MIKIKILATLTALTLPMLSFAASMIESRDAEGNLTQIYLQGDKARIEMPNNQGFAIMDVRNKTMQVVMHQQRMVMDMSDYMKGQAKGSSPTDGHTLTAILNPGGWAQESPVMKQKNRKSTPTANTAAVYLYPYAP